jgi:predicted DNA-binding transcriptional regulator YafY
VDRIEGKPISRSLFAPRKPPGGDFAAYVSRSLSYMQYTYRAQVKLHAPIETIAPRVAPTAGVLEALDSQSCLLHTGAHSLDTLCLHLALIGVDFEVHEPAELVDSLRQMALRLSRAAR